jgi:tetratricopeptide (TPR) repeat protein
VQSRSVWIATFVLLVSIGIMWLTVFLKKNHKSINGRKSILVASIVLLIIIGIGFGFFKTTEAFKTMKYRVASIFDTKSHDNQGRLMMWKSTWELANDNSLCGVGAGNWRIAILPYYEANHGSKYQNWRRPHNDFLWVFSEKGVIGVALYFFLFLIIVYYGILILRKESNNENKIITILLVSGIVAYFVTAQFSFPLERINHQVYLMLMMAGVISIYYKREKPSKKINDNYIFGGLFSSILISGFAVYFSVLMINSEVHVRKVYDAMNADDQNLVIINADKAFSIFTTVDYYAIPIYKYKGSANLKMRNLKQANKDFEIALKHFPTNILVLSYLAIVSAELHNNDQAISYLEKSIELYPHYEDGLHNLINIYYLEKDYEKAYLTLLYGNTQDKFKDYDSNMKALKALVNRPGK